MAESEKSDSDMSLSMKNTSLLLESIFPPEPDPLITDAARVWIGLGLKCVTFLFASLGTVTNTINIRVFIKQGLTSSTNTICLFALAIADLIGCILLVPLVVCDLSRHVGRNEAQAISCENLAMLVNEFPHLVMSRITCWITVYIAIERSLCVLVPFMVKTLLKPTVAIVTMAAIYLIVTSTCIPLYLNVRIEWIFMKKYNATAATFTLTAMGGDVTKFLSFVFNTVLSTVAAVITAVATGLMLYKLKEYKNWREKTATSGSATSENCEKADSKQTATGKGKRDVETLKAVVMVTGLFEACLLMSHIPGIAYYIVPGVTVVGINKNLEYVTYIYKFMFDSINSSLNFFFYIRVSSKYKAAYNAVFRKDQLS